MNDLVTRLHRWAGFGYGVEASATMHEAAAKITALEASLAEAEGRVAELQELLRIERQHRAAPGPF